MVKTRHFRLITQASSKDPQIDFSSAPTTYIIITHSHNVTCLIQILSFDKVQPSCSMDSQNHYFKLLTIYVNYNHDGATQFYQRKSLNRMYF